MYIYIHRVNSIVLSQVLSSGCSATPLAPPEEATAEKGTDLSQPWVHPEELPAPRPLNWLESASGSGGTWPRAADCAKFDLGSLCEVVGIN